MALLDVVPRNSYMMMADYISSLRKGWCLLLGDLVPCVYVFISSSMDQLRFVCARSVLGGLLPPRHRPPQQLQWRKSSARMSLGVLFIANLFLSLNFVRLGRRMAPSGSFSAGEIPALWRSGGPARTAGVVVSQGR